MEQTPPVELIESLIPYPKEIVELFLSARDCMFEIASDSTEFVNDAPYTVATGYTYTHSFIQGFVHITAYGDHINVGFDYGIHLSDPEGRLKGNGSRVRHIQLKDTSAVRDPYLALLIRNAWEKAHRPDEPMEAKTIVKRMRGAKTRP